MILHKVSAILIRSQLVLLTFIGLSTPILGWSADYHYSPERPLMEHDQWSVWIADSGGYKGSCVIEKTATGYRVGLGKDTIPDWSDLEGDDIIKMKNIEQTTSRGFTTSSGVSASSDVHRLYSFDSYTTPYYSTYYRAIVSPLTNYFIAEDVDGTTLAPSPTNQIMSQDLLCLCHKNKKLPVPLSEEEARTCGTALISLL